MTKNRSRKTYLAERTNAITNLMNITMRLRKCLNEYLPYSGGEDEIAQLSAAYVPAQLALLQLLKEESEEDADERTA